MYCSAKGPSCTGFQLQDGGCEIGIHWLPVKARVLKLEVENHFRVAKFWKKVAKIWLFCDLKKPKSDLCRVLLQ